jgi:predicted ATPase
LLDAAEQEAIKTSLSDVGFSTIQEMGQQIVKDQLEIKGNITPWANPTAFCETVITRSVGAFHQAQDIESPIENLVFFDRSFLNGVSYYQTLKIPDSRKYDHLIDELRYYPTLFMTPPWPEIFCTMMNENIH